MMSFSVIIHYRTVIFLSSRSCNHKKGVETPRSHGHRHYTPPINNQVSFSDLLDLIFKPFGIHQIRTKLFSISLPSLSTLFNECLQASYSDQSSGEYKVNSIILDIGNCRLFKPVSSSNPLDTPDKF